MGLLKSIFDAAIKVAAETLKEKQGNSYNQQEEGSYNRQEHTTTTATRRATDERQAAPVTQENYTTPGEAVNYFDRILADEFPQYEVRRNVPVTDLVGDANDWFLLYPTRPLQAYKAEWGQPYTFVLMRGGAPRGVVMLGAGHSHDQGVKYLIARMYARKLGLPYINFYLQMPNCREYVVERIRQMMIG